MNEAGPAQGLEVDDLVVERDGFRLGPVSFALGAGRRAAVVGPSGAGKTTLLRALAGLERPSAGSVRLGGRVLFDGAADLAPEKRGAALVFQDGALWPHMTALDHLRFVRPDLSREAAREKLARFGIEGCADRKPQTMSGGERRRLALARALVARPKVLLLDEPFHSVDVHRRDDLVLLVREAAAEAGLPLLVVTHDREEALALGDRILVLDRGRLVESGPAERLLSEPETAFAAVLLARAAAFPARLRRDGGLESVLGTAEAPPGEGPFAVVLLPNEAEAVEPGAGLLTARVLRCEPLGAAWSLTVALADRVARLRSARPMGPGAEVGVSPPRPLRALPFGAPVGEEGGR